MSSWHRRQQIPGPEALEGFELGETPSAPGRSYGQIIWLALGSHLRWGSDRRRVTVGNATLAGETRLPLRAVELGIHYLKEIGRIEASYRFRGKYGFGRTLDLLGTAPGPAPRIVLPKPDEMAAIWAKSRQLRERASSTVALAVAAYVWAAAEHRKLGKPKDCDTTVGALARLIGSPRGGSFGERLAVLEAVGILAKRGATWAGGFVLFAGLAIDALKAAIRELAPAPRIRVRSCAPEIPTIWARPPPEFDPALWEAVG